MLREQNVWYCHDSAFCWCLCTFHAKVEFLQSQALAFFYFFLFYEIVAELLIAN